MTRLQLRLWPLLLLILVAFIVQSSAWSFGGEKRTESSDDARQDKSHPSQELADDVWVQEAHDDSYRLASAALVHKATALLREIQPSSSLLAPFSKPTGILGSTAYYAKEIFFLLFMNGPPQRDLLENDHSASQLNEPLYEAVRLLDTAAQDGNADALFLLAEMNFYGNYTHPRNYSEAFRRYSELAHLTGNSSAQHMIGFMYATGIGEAVEQDQAKAMLYHTFAAHGGNMRSQMTTAYRHHSGIATPRDCEEAVVWYKRVADRAVEYMRSGPPGGHIMVKEAYRIADDDGGVYGEGASVSSSGLNAKVGGATSDAHASFDDVLEYLDLMSRKGDLKATFSLGKLHYDGSRELKRDLRVAKEYFLEVARTYWSKEGKIRQDVPPGTERLASKAAGYLGRMFLRGEGMKQSYTIAHTWFKRGLANGDALCQHSLGIMYLEGLGVPKDPVKAADYFGAAADQDLAGSQVRLGALFLDQGDVATAIKYFELAARNGHFEAFYYLAELSHQGLGRDKSCGIAVSYYKIVAEKAEVILSSIQEANEAYENGDLDTALVDFMMAAEQGFEIGQANVAYLLDKAKPRWFLNDITPFAKKQASVITDAALALIYWTRSAKQSNIDSMVKMGDYYLDGLGTPPDQEKAAACYQAAADSMQSAQAYWNLGWMHENGIGLDQDFHLAKRFYDQALETNREAYLPVTLALLKLRARSWWNTVTYGSINSIHEEEEDQKPFSFLEWLDAFLEADARDYYDSFEPDDWEHDGMPGGDGDYYDDIDEGIIESLVIVALTASLAFLVYYRQQRALAQRERAEREERQRHDNGGMEGQQQQQGQVGDGGFFPQPGDPAFNDWVAGGVGH